MSELDVAWTTAGMLYLLGMIVTGAVLFSGETIRHLHGAKKIVGLTLAFVLWPALVAIGFFRALVSK
jgi:uncharacterized membrane protein